jgi:hypothetical protein
MSHKTLDMVLLCKLCSEISLACKDNSKYSNMNARIYADGIDKDRGGEDIVNF